MAFVLTLSVGMGYWLLTSFADAAERHVPLIVGKWAPDSEEFIRQARQKGTSPEQEGHMREYLARTRITIRQNGSIDFSFPDKSGVFAYKAIPSADGCIDMSISKVGKYHACVSGRQMTLKDSATGAVESYIRI